MAKERIFSGIQPSGDLHLGNYLGAIKNWLTFQDTYESIFCVVDMHAITVSQDPESLRAKTRDIAKIYIAAGIDPKKAIVFVQSHVAAHAELCWILNCVARMGDMEKMTQFKDKSNKGGAQRASVGLFDYPVLMAADIILYDTVRVPVGDDQIQHVELARTLARRFNTLFGDTFIVPEYFIKKEGMRIMGLDDPSKKMSKSAPSEYNYISLTDTADVIRKKIRKAVTDSGEEIVYTDSKPALKNLINIYALLADITPEDVEKKCVGKRYGDFKSELAEVVVDFLVPFQQRMAKITDADVMTVLHAGAQKADVLAQKKMFDVRKKIGFVA